MCPEANGVSHPTPPTPRSTHDAKRSVCGIGVVRSVPHFIPVNWLSADPTEVESLNEIGVWINAPRVAKTAIDHFECALAKKSEGQ